MEFGSLINERFWGLVWANLYCQVNDFTKIVQVKEFPALQLARL